MKILPSGIAVIDGDSHISKWVESSGRLDHDQNLLPRLQPFIHLGDWIVDVGACIGDHTIAYCQWVGDTGLVIAFEPNIEAYQCLQHNCPKSVNINAGLSDRFKGSTYHTSSNAGAGFLQGEGSVTCLPLDLCGLPRVDFIKIDVEGMEWEVLQGARQTLAKFKPVLCVEMNVGALARNGLTVRQLIDSIEMMGYRYQLVYDSDTLDMAQFDLLFIPQSL